MIFLSDLNYRYFRPLADFKFRPQAWKPKFYMFIKMSILDANLCHSANASAVWHHLCMQMKSTLERGVIPKHSRYVSVWIAFVFAPA